MRTTALAALFAVLVSCAAPYMYNYYKDYQTISGSISLGMSTQEVRQAIGTPDRIELPEAFVTLFSPSGSPNQAIKNQQFWIYGDIRSGDKKNLVVMFKGTTVVSIYTVEKS